MNLPSVKVRVFGSYEVDVDVAPAAGGQELGTNDMISPLDTRHSPLHFRIPPYKVEAQWIALSETIDWGLAMLHVPDLWRETQGEGIKVGICDTGCDDRHPDLGNGENGAIAAAADFTGSRYGAIDKNGHGTHCAGIVAARHNQIGVAGVAPKSRLVVAKVLADNGAGSGESVAAGIDYCRDQGCRIISMSLGSAMPDSQILAAVRRASEAGCYLVMAAGNEGRDDSVNFPARWKLGLAVGAVDRNGQVTRFSSRGPEVDIAAPGQDVTSTWPGGGYAKLSGTSMATPFVAGVVALLLARNLQSGVNSPVHDMATLKEHLARTAKDAGPQGKDPAYGYGLINPESMLARQEPDPETGTILNLPLLGKVAIHAPAQAGDLFSIGIAN